MATIDTLFVKSKTGIIWIVVIALDITCLGLVFYHGTVIRHWAGWFIVLTCSLSITAMIVFYMMKFCKAEQHVVVPWMKFDVILLSMSCASHIAAAVLCAIYMRSDGAHKHKFVPFIHAGLLGANGVLYGVLTIFAYRRIKTIGLAVRPVANDFAPTIAQTFSGNWTANNATTNANNNAKFDAKFDHPISKDHILEHEVCTTNTDYYEEDIFKKEDTYKKEDFDISEPDVTLQQNQCSPVHHHFVERMMEMRTPPLNYRRHSFSDELPMPSGDSLMTTTTNDCTDDRTGEHSDGTEVQIALEDVLEEVGDCAEPSTSANRN